MTDERIVIDTSVLISALLSVTSTPARALERAITEGQLLASNATLRELVERFESRPLDRCVSREQRERLLQRLLPLVEIVGIVQSIRASRDPKDDQFLEVAVNGRADVLISGDPDLLALHPFRGIQIVTPAAYCERPAGAGG
jgi:putative PIN family toxin of toxin-antitoxin system